MKVNISGIRSCCAEFLPIVYTQQILLRILTSFIPFIAFLDELAEAAKCWSGIPHSFTPSALNAAARRLAFSLCRFMSSAAAVLAVLSAAL